MDHTITQPPVTEIPLSPERLDALKTRPWTQGFFPLLRRLNANAAGDPIGLSLLPKSEPFRIGQKPTLIFAPSEIADASVVDGKLRVRVYGLGMLGPNGPLPTHVTEIARERGELRADPTLCNFLDIFHHRSLTLLYRAWASAQSAASLDRPDNDRFSFYIGCMSGCSPKRRTLSMPHHARLAFAPHLLHEARNKDALSMSVAHHFGVSVHIDEWSDHWMELPSELHCKLGAKNAAARLGSGAMLGEHVLDRRHRFRMVVGPLDMRTYHRFTPRGRNLLRLVAWVRAYVGLEYEWLLELQIEPQSATPVVLGDEQPLGWSGWLGHPDDANPVVGMRFEPEQYVARIIATNAA